MSSIFHREAVRKYFEAIALQFKNVKRLSKSNLDYAFRHAIETFGIPYPDPDLHKYFLNASIIASLLLRIHNDDRLSANDRNDIQKNFHVVLSKLKVPRNANFIQYRVLGLQGIYPNINLKRGSCCYTINNHTPVLITRNSSRAEEVVSGSSEVQLLTRNELKMAVSILCAPESGLSHLYIPGYNQFRIDEAAFKKVPEELLFPFIHSVVEIHNYFPKYPYAKTYSIAHTGLDTYQFITFQENVPHFSRLFDAFGILNHLFMRTAFYLVKSIMLWDNRNFEEEAIASVFFSLEGCLHLLQEKYGVKQAGLDRQKLRRVFADNFYNREGLFEFIEEGYEKRVAIVHAKPFGQSEWTPLLMADDFYEYFQIARELLNFVLIDRVIDVDSH